MATVGLAFAAQYGAVAAVLLPACQMIQGTAIRTDYGGDIHAVDMLLYRPSANRAMQTQAIRVDNICLRNRDGWLFTFVHAFQSAF